MSDPNFDDLVASNLPQVFCGAHSNLFKLGSYIFEAEEDPSDGYRSYLQSVINLTNFSVNESFPGPIALVMINKVEGGSFNGYELRDVYDQHVWLRFETDRYDDWYPMFTFEYTPKEESLMPIMSQTEENKMNEIVKKHVKLIFEELKEVQDLKSVLLTINKIADLVERKIEIERELDK